MDQKTLELIDRFDTALARWCVPAPPRPTRFSIERINAHFDIALPETLIAFARFSRCFGACFASIGPDYHSLSHIIRINSYWRRRRPKRAIPKHLVAINLGHDDDMICIDKTRFCQDTGEYAVGYWCPDVDLLPPPAPDLSSYIEEMIKNR